jgi:cell cycle sensor histidine kinase DivJ
MLIESLKTRFKGAEAAALWSGPGEDCLALHGADGRFVRLSDSAEQVFGVPAAQLEGKRLMDVVAPAHQTRLLEALAALGRSDGPGVARFEFTVRAGDQLGATVETAISRTPRGFRSITRNIERRLAREQAILEESRRVTGIATRRYEQLANVSHEIRTPLNAVIGFADAIYSEQFGPMGNDRYRDYARIIHDSGQHLLSLISDFLDLSKAEANETAVQLAPESPAEIIRFCTELMALRVTDAGLTLRTDIDADIGLVMLDAKVVRQIVLNLLSNALKFTEQGGITVTVRREGAVLSIAVVDTGVGMSPDDLALVGKRFKQARSEGVRGAQGTGLGLSLSMALARVHGGELKLMSHAGEGTTALLRLPYQPASRRRLPTDAGSNVVPLGVKTGG